MPPVRCGAVVPNAGPTRLAALSGNACVGRRRFTSALSAPHQPLLLQCCRACALPSVGMFLLACVQLAHHLNSRASSSLTLHPRVSHGVHCLLHHLSAALGASRRRWLVTAVARRGGEARRSAPKNGRAPKQNLYGALPPLPRQFHPKSTPFHLRPTPPCGPLIGQTIVS